MKVIIALTIFFVFLCELSIYAQVDANHYANIVQSLNTGSAAYGTGFKGRLNIEGEIKGHPYLDTLWALSCFHFYSNQDSITTPARYNVMVDEFEVQTSAGIRALNGHLVKTFAIENNSESIRWVNAKDYKENGIVLSGFFEVLSEGEMCLLKQTQIEIVKPTYKISLDAGDKNTYLISKYTYYYANPDKTIVKLKKQNDLVCLFANKPEVSRFIKENSLSIKKEEHLKKIFDYFNALHYTKLGRKKGRLES